MREGYVNHSFVVDSDFVLFPTVVGSSRAIYSRKDDKHTMSNGGVLVNVSHNFLNDCNRLFYSIGGCQTDL